MAHGAWGSLIESLGEQPLHQVYSLSAGRIAA